MTTTHDDSSAQSIRRRDWRDLTPLDRERIESIWEEAFPPSERSAQDTVSRRDSTWLWTAHSTDGELIGFATALLLPTAAVAYLEYLAVSPSVRGGGVGAALLSSIAEDLKAERSVRGIVLEVEDPIRTPGADPLLARRVAFYERWGARPVESLSGYSMPDLARPGELVPMLVLWRGITEEVDLSPDGVKQVLTDLYQGYYAHAALDGHLEEMLRRVASDAR